MSNIKKLLIGLIILIVSIVIYASIDILTDGFITTGIAKYVSLFIGLSLSIFLDTHLTKKR